MCRLGAGEQVSEAQPHVAHHEGNDVIHKIEGLCPLFRRDEKQWSVDVKTYSDVPVNFAVYAALLTHHSSVMVLALPSSGRLISECYVESRSHSVHLETGMIIECEEW